MGARENYKHWTAADDAALRALYPHISNPTLADVMGRTLLSIKNRAGLLRLRKSAEYLAENNGQFKPGHTTWNTGLKGWKSGGRSAETRFKPGRRPEDAYHYRPIGSHRLNRKHGHLERKVTDDQTIYPTRRWVGVHRLVWEAANGPIPAGHVVRFKPGQLTTVLEEITLDRLECITRRENLLRNSYHTNYPPEVRRLVQLKAAIARQVNRINQEAQP